MVAETTTDWEAKKLLRPWFGPDAMQRERELAARAEAARRRRQPPVEDTQAGPAGEQVIAEAEAILASVEANVQEPVATRPAPRDHLRLHGGPTTP